jgi:hypothetical protein
MKTLKEMNGVPFVVLARIKDAVAGSIRLDPRVGGGVLTISGNWSRPMATATTYGLYKTPMVSSPFEDYYFDDYSYTPSVTLSAYRNTGTNNITVDYIAVFPRPFLHYGHGSAMSKFFILGNKIRVIGAGTFTKTTNITGDAIEFVPNRFNLLQSLRGQEDVDPVINDILTYTIYVTPRYNLL